VSALHRNAHIWNASHPLLVTYYWYSPGMEAKKIDYKNIFIISRILTLNALE